MTLVVDVTRENFNEVPEAVRSAMLRQLTGLRQDESYTVDAGKLSYRVTGQVIRHYSKG